MARIGSGTLVAGMTAAALVAIAALAVQASGSVPGDPLRRGPGTPSSSATSPAAAPTPEVSALPQGSGSGKRVAYAPAEGRVWLVDEHGKVQRTYTVVPGSLNPPPGRYEVTSRSARGTGGDGVTIEHVVRFAMVDSVVIGFSAARNSSATGQGPGRKTGGIREKLDDGTALWQFAVLGTPVVVVG